MSRANQIKGFVQAEYAPQPGLRTNGSQYIKG